MWREREREREGGRESVRGREREVLTDLFFLLISTLVDCVR